MPFSLRIMRRTFCTSQPSSLTGSGTAGSRTSLARKIYQERNLRQVVELFKKASEADRFRTTTAIYDDTVRRLATAKRFTWIEEILEDQKKYKNFSKESFAVRLIVLYGKSGMFEQALKTFDGMPERNCERTVLSFNALLGACVESKKFDRLQEIFREIPQRLSFSPDEFSYSILMKGFCEMGSFDLAISVLEDMKNNRRAPNVVNYNTLLSYLYGNGRFSDGEKTWAQMKAAGVVPNFRTYKTRLIGLATEKKMSEAVDFVDAMRLRGVKPELSTFNALIKGFCADGNLEEAKAWFHKIRASGLAPDDKTYAELIPVCCEKGNFDLALELCQCVHRQLRSSARPLLQRVVNGLFEKSKVAEARKLVEMVGSSDSCRFLLRMPSGF